MLWIVVFSFVARAAWNHYNVKKKGRRHNAQHSVMSTPQVTDESSSIRGWLDMKVKSGYSKFAGAFDEAGIEDVGDLAKVDNKVMTQLNEHLVAAGAKAMHLINIKEAIDEVRTPGAADAVELGLSGDETQGHEESKSEWRGKHTRAPWWGRAHKQAQTTPHQTHRFERLGHDTANGRRRDVIPAGATGGGGAPAPETGHY